jgi:hypothetical protein
MIEGKSLNTNQMLYIPHNLLTVQVIKKMQIV